MWDSFSWCRMRHEGRRISWYFSNGFLSDRLIIVAGKRSLANQPNKPRRSHPTQSPPFNYAFSSSMPFSASPFNLTINLSVFFCLEERERKKSNLHFALNASLLRRYIQSFFLLKRLGNFVVIRLKSRTFKKTLIFEFVCVSVKKQNKKHLELDWWSKG